MPKVGQSFSFRSSIGGGWLTSQGDPVARVHVGTITYVNREHRFFLVEARVECGVLRECFKF